MRTLLLRIVFAVYLVAMGFLVWLPNPDAVQYTGVVAVVARWFEPLGLPFEPTYIVLEILANVVLFVPFGLLIALLVPTRWWWLVVVGLIAIAAAIELGQALFLPGRVASLDDVIANSTGGVVGVAIAAIIRGVRWAIRRARRSEPQT